MPFMTTPVVEGPIAGEPANRMPPALADEYGYVEEEWFLSGEATAYVASDALAADGRWAVAPGETVPYRTRVIVRRPADLADFNGTVVVEWFNVTSSVDADPDFGLLHPVLLGGGYAYVGVSAQQVSIGGGTGLTLDIPGLPAGALLPLTERLPDRYGSLHHPGDTYSFDIYAQVAAAARAGDLLGGAVPTHVIAIGESQSAFRLVTFVNAVHPVTHAYDGYLVHSRGVGAAPLEGSQAAPDPEADTVAIRSDLDVPVLQLETETDLVTLGFLAARQPDTDLLRTWEVAGTAHADASLLEYGAKSRGAEIEFDLKDFLPSINTGPQREVLRAAFVALVAWVRDGTAPASAPPIEIDADGRLQRDADGNVLGGVRTPAVDAPIATHTGESDSPEIMFQLFGASDPLPPERVAELYATHDDYVRAVTASADEAVAAGFLLAADRDVIVEAAHAAEVPA
jgi:hypothetical protein